MLSGKFFRQPEDRRRDPGPTGRSREQFTVEEESGAGTYFFHHIGKRIFEGYLDEAAAYIAVGTSSTTHQITFPNPYRLISVKLVHHSGAGIKSANNLRVSIDVYKPQIGIWEELVTENYNMSDIMIPFGEQWETEMQRFRITVLTVNNHRVYPVITIQEIKGVSGI